MGKDKQEEKLSITEIQNSKYFFSCLMSFRSFSWPFLCHSASFCSVLFYTTKIWYELKDSTHSVFQEALHELIIEARQSGANEPEIKEHINRYLKEILSPEKLSQFEEANAKFERERFSKKLSKWYHTETDCVI